jgi:adenylate cyclase
MHEGLGIELNLEGIPDRLHDNDALLADVLSRGPYVMGYKFLASDDGRSLSGPLPLDIIILHDAGSAEATVALPGGTGIVAPLPVFAEVISRSGFVNVRPDDDGVIRRIPLLMRFEGRIYPSLALASVMQAVNAQRVFLKVSTLGAESLRVNKTVIPVDASGNLLIRYRGKRKSFEYIGAADLLNDRIDTKRVSGRVVFVGATAAGLKDTYATPLDSLYPGVEVHASVADNILHGVFLNRPVPAFSCLRHCHSVVWRAGYTKDGKRVSFPNLSSYVAGCNVCFSQPSKVPPSRKTGLTTNKGDGTDRE